MRVTIEQIRDEISDRLEVVGVWITSRTNPRSRWIGSTFIVLGLHAVFFWVLVVSKTENMRLKPFEEEVYPVELWEVPPPPEDIPEPVPEPIPEETVQEEVETVTPPQVEPEPQPQAQPVPQPQPSPVESPRRSLTVKPMDMPDLARKQQPTAQNQTQRDVSLNTSPAPTASPVPARNLGVKKRNEDDQVSARTQETARSDSTTRDVSNLNLHQPDRVAPNAQASGLTPAARKPAGSAGGGGGGMPGAGLPPGSLQGLSGGRSGVSQAIQNHNSCVAIQQAGKPIPESCDMSDLAVQGRMGPKPDRDFQNAANQRDANLRYKTTPGSTDYWKRVNSAPTPGSGGRDDDLPKKGAYSSEKDARVMNGDNIDPKNGN
ncbi:hypothetical protein [Asticcacaulis biprosthecium]|uniref:hypothetical protein n=1 Tax=Asticcacaulis biprosthecium TaxID=76891 RepID=UPI0002DED32B|nr:hypothetical protein [Asticcacaulis biprosthecium]